MVWGQYGPERSRPRWAQTLRVKPARLLRTDPAPSEPGSAFNARFAQRLARCWLPGVRNPREFPATLLGGWLGGGLWWPRWCGSLRSCLGPSEGSSTKLPPSPWCDFCLSERIIHPTKALYLSSSARCCQTLTCRYVQSAAGGRWEPVLALGAQELPLHSVSAKGVALGTCSV